MNIETHSSIWGYKEKNKGRHGTEDLDMERNRIINLGKPNKAHHAATMSYVLNVVSHKVNVSGDTLEGNIDMNYNRITSVGDPVDETDVVNKQYVDGLIQSERSAKPYEMGRYIVFPHDDGTKAYFSVRARKNIDLERDKVVEIKYNTRNRAESMFNDRPDDITIIKDITPLPNPDKVLGVMSLNSTLGITFPNFFSAPWTLLLLAKPGDPAVIPNNETRITFYNSDGQFMAHLTLIWALEGFSYVLGNNDRISFNVDIRQFNHIALKYVGTTLTIWLNGIQVHQHNINLDTISDIIIGVKELGIVSFYDRDLTKMEMIQHFIDNHVENFTNDEVLI